jgi:hypothetical protein
MLPEFLRALKERGYKVVHIVPAAGVFPTNRISAGWTSETEPIVERVLAKYRPRAKGVAQAKRRPVGLQRARAGSGGARQGRIVTPPATKT